MLIVITYMERLFAVCCILSLYPLLFELLYKPPQCQVQHREVRKLVTRDGD